MYLLEPWWRLCNFPVFPRMTSDAKRTCPLSNDLQNFTHSCLLNKHAKIWHRRGMVTTCTKCALNKSKDTIVQNTLWNRRYCVWFKNEWNVVKSEDWNEISIYLALTTILVQICWKQFIWCIGTSLNYLIIYLCYTH